MRKPTRDSLPRRWSPSPTKDRDANESSRVTRRDVSSRSGRSPFQADGVSRGFEVRRTVREQDVDGIRRESRYSAPYELDRDKRDGFSDECRREEEERDYERHREHSHLHKTAFSGVDYPNRSDSTETVHHVCGGLMRSSEDPYWRQDAEPFRSTMKHLSDELGDKYSPSHGRNVLRNDKTDRLESFFRDCSDSSHHRSKPFPTSEVEQTEAIVVAMKGERYSEDGRDRDTYRRASSPLSQIESSGVDSQDESSRCCIRGNDLGRVNDTGPSYSGNRCASQILQTRHLDDYDGRNSPRDQQGESMQDLTYPRDFNCGDHGSPAMSMCGKEIVDESRKFYQKGSGIEAREFPGVGHDVKNMSRETDLLMQARGSLSKSYVRGSSIVDVNAADTHLEFCTKVNMADQHDFVKEHYPFIELGSSLVNEQDDKAHHHMNFHYKERDQKCQLLEKDYQSDGVDSGIYLDFNGPIVVADHYDKAPQSKALCLNKESEAYLDHGRKAVYSDDKRRELRNEYRFGYDDRIHSDLHEANIVVDRNDRAPQNIAICFNKESETYVDNERKVVYLDGN